jgi:RHS repeat-associated protein
VQVVIVEEINNIEYVIGSGYLNQGSKQSLNFTPTFDVAKLKVYGPFDEMLIGTTCTKKAATVQHTYLVDVCDEDKDRYRFGFNGMEKDNELKGIGNSLDFGARMYDSRIGKFLSLDPLAKQFPWNTPYSFAENDVIRAIDEDGERRTIVHKFINEKTGKEFIVATTSAGLMRKLETVSQKNILGKPSGSYTQAYNWYDYTTTYEYSLNTTTGKYTLLSKKDEPGELRGSSPTSWLNGGGISNESEAINKYENSFWKSVREKTRDGGIEFTSTGWNFKGQTTEFNARAKYPDGKSENLDDLIGMIGIANSMGHVKGALEDVIRFGVNATGAASSLQSESLDGIKLNTSDKKPYTVCESCKNVTDNNGNTISSDSAGKVITPTNSDTVSPTIYHK